VSVWCWVVMSHSSATLYDWVLYLLGVTAGGVCLAGLVVVSAWRDWVLCLHLRPMVP
jgi:hypothetical protein